MKKEFFAWVLVAMVGLMVSCSEDAPNIQPPQQAPEEVVYYTPKRTMAQAIEIAQMAVQNEQAISRSERTVSNRTAVKVITDRTSRSEADTLLYVVEYEDNKGFALIAAPKCVTPVIAVIDEGSFEDEELAENDGFQYALDAAKDYVSTYGISIPDFPKPIIPEPITPAPLPFYEDTIFPTPKTVPLVAVKWGQRWPENMYAPNGYAGCGPVAIAQILTVFEPNFIWLLTFPEMKNNLMSVSWSDVKKHEGVNLGVSPDETDQSNHYTYSCSATPHAHTVIGCIIRQIGVDTQAEYNIGGTGIYYVNAFSELRSYLSNKNFIERSTSSNLFQDLLKNNGVAYVRGENENGGGHAWVADGTWSIGTRITYYTYNSATKQYDVKVSGYNNQYVHYNWGWYGSGNGYFSTGIFNSSNAYEYDNPYSTGSDVSYSKNVRYLCIY